MPSTQDKTAGQSHDPNNSRTVTSAEPWGAALYGRVSDARHGDSVDEQDTECTAACAAEGWPVIGRYSDELSASRFARKTRPDFERLIADIEARRVQVVVVWETSRLTRDLEVGARLLTTCRAQKVRVHVYTHRRTYNLRVARDWRSLAEDIVDAAYESEKTSERTGRSRKASAAKGRPHGRVHYGYERLYDPHTRKLACQRPHPEQAPIVAEIKRRIGAGVPVSVLTAELNTRGVPAPRGQVWLRSTVRNLAMSPVYIGQRVYSYIDEDGTTITETLAGNWPALITVLEHHAAVAVLTDPARRTTRPGAQKWLLSYLAVCGRCGDPLSVRAVRGVPTYVCASAAQCSAIGVARLDDLVTKAVLMPLSDPGAFAALLASDDAAVLAARTELAELEGQWKSFCDAAVSGAALARVEARLAPAIAAARRRLSEVSTPPALRPMLTDGPGDYQVMAARFAGLSVAQRKAIVRAMVTVTLAPAHRSRSAPLDRSRVMIDPVT